MNKITENEQGDPFEDLAYLISRADHIKRHLPVRKEHFNTPKQQKIPIQQPQDTESPEAAHLPTEPQSEQFVRPASSPSQDPERAKQTAWITDDQIEEEEAEDQGSKKKPKKGAKSKKRRRVRKSEKSENKFFLDFEDQQ